MFYTNIDLVILSFIKQIQNKYKYHRANLNIVIYIYMIHIFKLQWATT